MLPPFTLAALGDAGEPPFRLQDQRLFAVRGRNTSLQTVSMDKMFVVYGRTTSTVTVSESRTFVILDNP